MRIIKNATPIIKKFNLNQKQAGIIPACSCNLLQAEGFGDFSVYLLVCSGEIVEEFLASGDHAQEAPAGVEIFLVLFEVVGEFLYLFAQESDLIFRRAGVGIVTLDFFGRFNLLFGRKGHMHPIGDSVVFEDIDPHKPDCASISMNYLTEL